MGRRYRRGDPPGPSLLPGQDGGFGSPYFALEEKFRINIRKDVLESMGILPGPWLTSLKEKIALGANPETPIRAFWKDESDGSGRERYFSLGEL